MEGDSTSFKEAMRSVYSFKWQEAMEVEMNSKNTNEVQDLEEISNGTKTVDCKRVYKTKRDSKGNIERYKVEMNLMTTNDVWDLEVIPNGVKIVGC